MMKQQRTFVALSTLGVMLATTLGGLWTPAHAGSKGRRNTTLALGAVTAYGLLKGNKKVAIAGGVGTAIAYSRYRSAKKRERRYRYGRNNGYNNYRYGSRRYANSGYSDNSGYGRRSYRRGKGHYKGQGKGHRKHRD